MISLLLAGTVMADTIYFKSGSQLECKVIADTPEGVLVQLGNENKGSMVIPRPWIERIEYDFDTRLDALKPDDFQGHYKLGVWCEEHIAHDVAMADRALGRYLYVRGKPDVPDEVLLRLGRMYEKCKESSPVHAYHAYEAYLKLHKDSAEAAEAMKRLKPIVDKETAAPPVAGPSKDEGLEIKPWRWENWGNGGSVQSLVDSGNKTSVLVLKFKSGGKSKSAFGHTLNADLSTKKALLFDVNNTGKSPVKIAVALVTGGNFEWFESRTISAAPEAWTIGLRFDLTMMAWKSQKSNWRHQVKPANLNRVRNLVILVYNGRSDGVVYLDAIRFEE